MTWVELTAYQPAFASIPFEVQAQLLAWVDETVSKAAFGGDTKASYKLAQLYLLAHACTLYRRGCESVESGAAGPVLSESAGGLSVSYANGASVGSFSAYESTPYGAMYLELIRTSPIIRGPFVL